LAAMVENVNKVTNTLKLQAELFLLDAGEFFPFGTYINKDSEIVPVGAYVENENDRPPSSEVIELLEKAFNFRIENGECKIAGIAIDINIKENNAIYDGIEMRFFEPDKKIYKRYLKYQINKNSVDFFET
jgi:hypothetical protein